MGMMAKRTAEMIAICYAKKHLNGKPSTGYFIELSELIGEESRRS